MTLIVKRFTAFIQAKLVTHVDKQQTLHSRTGGGLFTFPPPPPVFELMKCTAAGWLGIWSKLLITRFALPSPLPIQLSGYRVRGPSQHADPESHPGHRYDEVSGTIWL